ncbi:MAG: hypothetical protein KA885_10855 [Spirochaetes bacterium]|nr:hypothetical protein [Spirochaetota bacterium]
MKRIINGVVVGIFAGIIDVIPMILQKISVDANLSAFTMWVVVGFLISTSELKINAILKGLIIALLTVTPILIIVGWKEPASLIPIIIMTLILGSASGFVIGKLNNAVK